MLKLVNIIALVCILIGMVQLILIFTDSSFLGYFTQASRTTTALCFLVGGGIIDGISKGISNGIEAAKAAYAKEEAKKKAS